MNVSGPTQAPPLAKPNTAEPDRKLTEVARQLEASFLAEMLKSAGVGEARQTFGGGAGEDHFSSFLVREYADATVQAGGLGLAESIYRSLVQMKEADT